MAETESRETRPCWLFAARLWLLCAVWIACILFIWNSGIVGNWLLLRIGPRFLPRDIDEGFFITRVAIDDCALVPDRGLCVSMSPSRLRKLLRDVSPLFALLPPGIIQEDVVLHGHWLPEKASPEHTLPITLSCNHEAGDAPWAVFRFPVDDLNALLKAELAEEWRETESYIFGSYDLNQRVWFRTLSVQSEDAPRGLPDAPIRFTIGATGKLRYNFEDGIIDATISAKVKRLNGTIAFRPVRHRNGIGFQYECHVDELSIAVDNMAPWIERKLADELKASIERSMNKRRKREKYERMRLPLWTPLNLVVDVAVSEQLR
mgnify:CR=1 FL=1